MEMKGARVQLLYVGNEAPLSKATAELFRRAGYKVRTTNPAQAHHKLREDNFAAIILCATLTGDETGEIVETVMSWQPDTPVVSVHLGRLGDAPNAHAAVIVDVLQGPDALLTAVQSVARMPVRPIGKAV